MELVDYYNEKKKELRNRLKDFEVAGYRKPKDIFKELCFCLLTPANSALRADKAIQDLTEKGLLFEGNEKEVAKVLRGNVRFHNNKAKNIVMARHVIDKLKLVLSWDNKKAREFLVENVRGLGWKEASHFLRNVGKGSDIAIVDRHILKNLMGFGFIDEIPKTITKKRYHELETKVEEFSKKFNIPMDELDLLLWSKETGKVFK